MQRPCHSVISSQLILVFAGLMCFSLMGGQPAVADDLSDRHVDNIYKRYMPEIANVYVAYNDRFLPFPKYDPRRDNSSGIDGREWLKQNVRKSLYYDRTEKRRYHPLAKDKAELDAVTKTIPDFRPGSYGYFHSGIVRRVKDDTITLSSVWLVDEEVIEEEVDDRKDKLMYASTREINQLTGSTDDYRSYNLTSELRNDAREEVDWQFEEREKLIQRQERMGNMQLVIEGIRTRGIRVGERWPSDPRRTEPIAVAKVVSNRVHAIPVKFLRRKLTPSQFEDMLKARGFDKRKFAELILEARQEDARNYMPIVIAELEYDPTYLD